MTEGVENHGVRTKHGELEDSSEDRGRGLGLKKEDGGRDERRRVS